MIVLLARSVFAPAHWLVSEIHGGSSEKRGALKGFVSTAAKEHLVSSPHGENYLPCN